MVILKFKPYYTDRIILDRRNSVKLKLWAKSTVIENTFFIFLFNQFENYRSITLVLICLLYDSCVMNGFRLLEVLI